METLFDITDALRKIRIAFSILRHEGVNARTNYLCCYHCVLGKAPSSTSLVYYSRDDVFNFRRTGVLPIRILPPHGDGKGTGALIDQIRIILELQGLETEIDCWQAIKVMA